MAGNSLSEQADTQTCRAALLLQRGFLRFERLKRRELIPADAAEREWMLAMIASHKQVIESIEEMVRKTGEVRRDTI